MRCTGMRSLGVLGIAAGLALFAGCTARTVVDTPDAFFPPDARPDAGDVGSACTVDSQCADRIACTVDHCTAGVCEHVPCTDCCGTGRACDTMLGCGPAPQPCSTDAECNDMQPCTLDSCRDRSVCQHMPMDALCPSGQICVGGTVGCVPRPPATCTTAADCASIGFCYGTWECAHEIGCAYLGPVDCDDGDTCTADACDMAMGACTHTPRDADGDHHAAASCSGDDCDDTNAAIHPGATEVCNRVDDDCDSTVDEGCCTPTACTTACGTAGMTSCNPDGTTGPCMPPAETCDGADDDCDGGIDEGFDCVRGAVSACATSCGSMGSSTCDASCHAGACTAPAETCNGADDDCNGAPDDTFACVRGTSSACPTACGSTGTRTCNGACSYDLCVPPAEVCNGVDDNCNAACDEGFGCCARSMVACTSLGFRSGMATCRGDCTGYDTSTCSNCGNGALDTGEQCDGSALGGATCTSIGMGFNAGTLGCHAASCTYDTTLCTRCGDMIRNGPEQCDGADLAGATCASRGYTGGGALGCTSGCLYDTSACIWSPTGTWSVAPGVTYYCGFGAVMLSFGNLMFNDTGSSLTVSGGNLNCMMTGASARATRTFDVTCTLTGGCNETYRLTGSFTGDNTWTGTFRATFTGSQCGLASCASQTFSGLTGTR